MSALLIPLSKGFLGLMGISSFMFISIKKNVELQIQEIELEAAELQLKQQKLELKAVPEKK
ncbi:MAG: hypothetical protein CMO60_09660 [Verrucomicrobiales bacterium]|nr:hypothetical protein [Verrucomicrobiales bacterium]